MVCEFLCNIVLECMKVEEHDEQLGFAFPEDDLIRFCLGCMRISVYDHVLVHLAPACHFHWLQALHNATPALMKRSVSYKARSV